MRIVIMDRHDDKILFEHSCLNNTMVKTIKAAALQNVSLENANLSYLDLKNMNIAYEKINLSHANLTGSDLTGSYLSGINLEDAFLDKTILKDTGLAYAELSYASFDNAFLVGTDLTGARLNHASFSNAYLNDVDLTDITFEGADLTPIKNDFFRILLRAIPEIPNLVKALIDGKIDGSIYEGYCACLCGTLEKSKNYKIKENVHIERNSDSPIERFFMNIHPGDNTENSEYVKQVFRWLIEFDDYINGYDK
jgi:hypothetical protein